MTDAAERETGPEEPRLLGRETELKKLESLLELPPPTTDIAVLITGPAGAGKTALLPSATVTASRNGYHVLESHPVEAESKLSFVGLRDLLDADFDQVTEDLPLRQRGALATALLREGSGEADAAVVCAATLAAIRAISSHQPVLIAIDDLPWLDPATKGVIGFVVRRLRDDPIRAVFSARCDSPDEAANLTRTIGGDVTKMWLEPLSFGAIQSLIRSRLGLVLPRPTMRLFYEASAGNPLYALELARLMVDQGRSLRLGRPLDLPTDLRMLVGERIATLGPAARTVLPIAAAIARPTVDDLIAVTGDATTVEAALADGLAHGVFRMRGDQVEFTHPLLAAAAYSDVPNYQRRDLHQRIAWVVGDIEERAHHLALAAPGPSEELARTLDEAAAVAAARGAPAAAAALGDDASRATLPTQVVARSRRQVNAAIHHFEAGDTNRAMDLLEEVMANGAAGPAIAEAAARLGRILVFRDELERAAGIFRLAVESPDAEPALRVEAEEGLAWCLLLAREDLEEAYLQGRRAVETGLEFASLTKHLEEALAVSGLTAVLLGKEDGADLVTEAVESAGERRYERVIRHPLWASAVRRLWMDNPVGAREELLTLRQWSFEGGDESSLPRVLLALSHAHLLIGDFESAATCAREGSEAADHAGQEPQAGMLLWTASMVDAHTGHLEAAHETASRRLELATRSGHVVAAMANRWTLGFCAMSRGDLGQAQEHLSFLAERHEAAGVEEPGALRFVPDLITVSIQLGRYDEARRLLGRYVARANATGRASAKLAAARCQALLAAAEGGLTEASRLLREVIGHTDAQMWPFERARSLMALGAVLRRSRQLKEARETLEAAAKGFERLGATAWVEQAHEEMGRVGGRARSRWQLTPAEGRIARLVAEGRTNKEVAAELFVTVKTVETSLTRIYRKLGIRSRAQLARVYASSEIQDKM